MAVAIWPRCLLWRGWLPGLSTAGERDPWAACLGQLSDRSLGSYPVDDAGFWTLVDHWDAEDLATEIGEHPCVWTDGSREVCPTGSFEVVSGSIRV